ncbi:MAG TPA: GNAT family N-acetyltransferase [Flavisolibacter sp.]|nr:GNAT family N-acetyltransferase [Flavisolibacter sp.]
MEPLLRNPVYHSLLLNDQHLGSGSQKAKYFYKDVSPFAGFEEGYAKGFGDLYDLLPASRTILYASPLPLIQPQGWNVVQEINGLQFLFEGVATLEVESFRPATLEQQHVEQMMKLAALTKPGPFGPRTIEFGHYYGVFEKGQLVAMTGQRLHVHNFTEISAVCTHPDHLGKGYASALIKHQVNLILSQDQTPFLHVRADNHRAIAVYERLGFKLQGTMNFYVMKK